MIFKVKGQRHIKMHFNRLISKYIGRRTLLFFSYTTIQSAMGTKRADNFPGQMSRIT